MIQKKMLAVLISCMMFVLCGCGVIQLFQNNNPKDDMVSEIEKDTQHDISTEVLSDTEIEMKTDAGTEVEETTEVAKETTEVAEETGNEKATDVTAQAETNSQPGSNVETQTNVGNNTQEKDTQNVETSNEETPKEETPTVAPFEPEKTEPARGEYLVKGQDLSTASLSVGDGMYDITVTTVDGETLTISELLKEKDVVILNFWYISCYWCDYEFPFMSQAYNSYKGDVEIIALNWYDNQASIVEYKNSKQLPFKVAQCAWSWANAFGVSGYPTSIIIDRYGVICEIKPGAITSVEGFNSVFERYIGDDYQPAY